MDTLSHTLIHSSKALVKIPTAGGKTLIFTEFLKKWEKPGRKFAVIVNRNELVHQTYNRFKNVFKSVSVYSAGYGEKSLDGNIIIASIQSLNNVMIPNLACLTLDEVHHFSKMDGQYGSLIERHPNAKVIGFTATPWNNNKPIYGMSDSFFNKIDFEIKMSELIKDGFIVPPIFKAPEHQLDTSKLRTRLGEYLSEDVDKITLDVEKIKLQIIDALPRLVYRKKIIWVCASINHAQLLMGALKKAGEDAAIIHSRQVPELQKIQREKFELGDCRHMCCVMMATEGYDYPAIDAVCFMRPTKSAVLFCQVIGRALRLSPGKTDALILDYGRVVENCGPIEDPKIVNYTEALPKEAMKYSIWACPRCFSYVESTMRICKDCGYEKEPEKRDEVKNLTVKPAQFDNYIDILIGKDTGIFKVQDVKISAHWGRKSKKPSIKIKYVLEGRQDHDDYITESQWSFKWRYFKELVSLTDITMFSDGGGPRIEDVCFNLLDGSFLQIFNYLEDCAQKKHDQAYYSLPYAINITKNDKGFYSVKLIWQAPERIAD